jgi:RecJ-like exonuclease
LAPDLLNREKIMKCETCAHWIQARKTLYDDGSEVVNFQAPEGKGHCESLNLDTDPGFGCTGFIEGCEHVIVARKSGAPWQHSSSGPCPNCNSCGNNQNDGACERCQGTGKVRYYDDGFIGEERTRLHPKEKELAAQPKCRGCDRMLEREWMACPFCGTKTDAPAAVEVIADGLSVV